MLCTSCGYENPEETNFCIECGVPLQNICPNCGNENLLHAKFCGKCGTSIKEITQITKPIKHEENGKSVEPSPIERGVPEAERRQLTVMFCDLVGSTALSEKLDPEELRELMHEYQQACANVVNRFDGHIAKYLGDGILVYFGYPMAHEDDAQRAVRAGLEIVSAVREVPLQDEGLQVRIGIHTGLVVVGEMGGGDTREPIAIVGETPNIAARLQEIAKPNTVVIGSSTYRLIYGYFDCKALGTRTLKGLTHPMEVYQVLKGTGVQSRLEIAMTKGLTPLVGRDKEIGMLLESWERVKEGEGQVVLLSGEAGIGKSRLVQILKDHVAREPHVRIESRCSPYYQNTAFYPVIDHLQRVFDFKREDPPEEKLSKLESVLKQYGFLIDEVLPLFASLLSVPLYDRYTPFNLSPQRQKQKTIEALLSWLLKEAEKQPVLRIMEDLHWVDPSTLEFLSLLVNQVPIARIFTIFTFRPNFMPPWGVRSHLNQINLTRLSKKQIEVMVHKLAGGKALPDEVVNQVVTKTDGVPLFVEELTKMVLESGMLEEVEDRYELTGPIPPLAIPFTLQDSLTARLDRLATVKEVAQLGATLGRTFTYELLQAVSLMEEMSLQKELNRLVEAEILYQRGIPPQARYIFKHALIQDAAYQSLLRSKRQQYHQKIAVVLEMQFPETVETEPELLAQHYTEAGLIEQAIPYWHRAGQRAIERSANVEAINHVTMGLELLKNLPDTPEQNQQELDFQTTLGPALMAAKGYAAPEVGQAYLRAWELCKQVGETPQLFPVLFGLWQFYNVRAELYTARERANELLSLAQNTRDEALLLQAHHALWSTLLYLGELPLARKHAERGVAIYDKEQHRSLAFVFGGHDPGTCCRGFLSFTLWLLGYPDQALKMCREALTLAQELSHPFSIVHALTWAAWLNQLHKDGQETAEKADAAITLSTEQGFSQWIPLGNIMRGWALAEQGQLDEGIENIKRGLSARRERGSDIGRTYFLALLAEANSEAGQIEEGITVLAESLKMAQKNGERFYQAELYRLNGELLITHSSENHAEAETCFRKAIDVSRHQSAKSFELRAVMSLVRLLQKQGKKEEARQMLSEIYGWFTEGFETKDLKEANSLLEELS